MHKFVNERISYLTQLGVSPDVSNRIVHHIDKEGSVLDALGVDAKIKSLVCAKSQKRPKTSCRYVWRLRS